MIDGAAGKTRPTPTTLEMRPDRSVGLQRAILALPWSSGREQLKLKLVVGSWSEAANCPIGNSRRCYESAVAVRGAA